MKEIRAKQARDADEATKDELDTQAKRLNVKDSYSLFLLHRAIWTAHAGAEVVIVKPQKP